MSTQKALIHHYLFHYIAQRADHISRVTHIPAPSVRRVLGELVAAGKAKFVQKDLFGYPGYLAVTPAQQARHAGAQQ